MPRNRSRGTGAGRRSAPRAGKGNAGSFFGYLLLLLLLLAIWVRTTHKPWWDQGWNRARQALSLTPASPPAPATPAESMRAPAAIPAGCGVERWRLKVLADADGAALSQAVPKDVTLEQLVNLPRPAQVDESRRSPAERQTYRVQAQLLRYKQESDRDFHLVLADDDNPRLTMVAEIPAGGCALDDNRGALFDELREDVTLRFGPAGADFFVLPAPARVQVTGVGFFDSLHGQSGMAANGFELHPVLDLRVQ